MKYIIATLLLLIPSLASAEDCAPYYVQNGFDSPGSKIFSAFLLPGMAVVSVPVVAISKVRDDVDGDRAICGVKAMANHLTGSRK